MRIFIFAIAALFILSACENIPEESEPRSQPSAGGSPAPTTSNSRYKVDQDYYPDQLLNPDEIQDAIPRDEYVSKNGNKSPYTVLGKTYYVLPTAKGYKETGTASLYGMKFDGYATSNGETYRTNEMTAAHKTLPLPSYVKVTNLENGRTAIVRVNDRGPFHEGRIIDLSYAAATKLGYQNKGTAQVTVEAIDPKTFDYDSVGGTAIIPVNINSDVVSDANGGSSSSNNESYPPVSQPTSLPSVNGDGRLFLQVGAYLEKDIAMASYKKLAQKYGKLANIQSGDDNFYRLRIGPISESDVDRISKDLQREGFPEPMPVR